MKPKPSFSLPAIFLLGVLFISGLSGCAAGTPTATPGHNILYAFNFENQAAFSGWHVGGPGTDYFWLKNTKNGKYLFEYPSGFLESQDFDFADVQVAVDVEFLVKTRVEAGAACRMQPGASGRYYFSIANDGRWNIRKWNNAETILAEGWSEAIQPAKNRLAARCVGDQLTLLVNDTEVGSAHDGDFVSGSLNFGYMAESAGAGTFDNITVEDWGAGQASAPQPKSETGEILYAENFDNPDKLSGWDAKVDDKSQANPQDGAYRLGADGGMAAFIQREQSFTDAIIEVDVQFLGSDPARAGVICRNDAGQYQFTLSSAGEWTIESSGKTFTNGQAAMQSGFNHLEISCVGSQLGFALNGTQLGAAQDDAFKQGQIGLTLDSKGKAEVLFDNLTVRRPAAQAAETAPTQVAALEPATLTPAPVSTATRTLIPIPAATLRPTVIPEGEQTLYQTDFDASDPTLADWKTFAFSMDKKDFVTAGYKTWVANGNYRFEQEANTRVFAIYDKDLGTADVDLSMSGNPPFEGHGGLGLVCRYSEAGWYQFMVEPSGGRWSIRLVKPDENGQYHFHIISYSGVPKWLEGKANLRAECKGDRLTFYINDEKMASLHDATFPTGKIGFVGWSSTFSEAWNTVDNFSARRAQWNETGLAGPALTPGSDGTIYSTDFAKLDDLNPYWSKTDLGVIGIPGSPILIGGPGGQVAPHTYLYINDFDPATDVEINAAIHPAYIFRRGLICRYSEDGWYEAYYLNDGKENPIVLLRKQRDEQGKFTGVDTILGNTFAGSQNSINLTLTCAGNQISVKLNGEQVIRAEDSTWTSGRYGFLFMDNSPGNLRNTLLNYTVRPVQSSVSLQSPVVPVNQVSLPSYPPGETIFAWDRDAMLYRPGLDGKQSRPWNWSFGFDGAHPPQRSENAIRVTSIEKMLTYFAYRPDLYDLPIEISAEATLTSKGGGMALFCRATAVGRYEFYIQPDGEWYIRRNVIAEFYLPKAKHLTTLAHGTVENFSPENMQLNATCNGPDLIFTLNGAELGRAQDTLYPEGQAGIFFDVFSEGNFTNLVIKRAK